MDRRGRAAVELTWMEFPCGALGCHRRCHRFHHRYHRNRRIGLSWHSVGWTRPVACTFGPQLEDTWPIDGLCIYNYQLATQVDNRQVHLL